jgi:hypothetical protein
LTRAIITPGSHYDMYGYRRITALLQRAGRRTYYGHGELWDPSAVVFAIGRKKHASQLWGEVLANDARIFLLS